MTSPTLFLAWQAPQSRQLYTVGRLSRTADGQFEFVYTAGVRQAQADAAMPLLAGMTALHQRYLSATLFPHFQNRLMSPSREEFALHIDRLGLTQSDDPLVVLARSGGRRETDSFLLYAEPQRVQTETGALAFRFHFFTHGMRYMPVAPATLTNTEPLRLLWDFQNPKDAEAVMVLTANNYLLGWVPRYYSGDVLRMRNLGAELVTRIEHINPGDAPPWYRALCTITASCTQEFRPLDGPEHGPLA
jgi:hypothetical protein